VIETLELTPSHVGLGDLNEFALLTLVANTHYRILTQGTGATPRTILDKAGEALYPSVFALHLRAPVQRPIEAHALWEKLSVGADVRCFGRSFLDVRGVVGRAGEVPHAPETWTSAPLPSVSWAGAWTLKGEVAMPAPTFVANVPQAAAPPELLRLFRAVQSRGTITEAAGPSAPSAPILYPVEAGRDVARGRQMMFSQFVVVTDHAERVFLTERVWPAFPCELVDCRTTLERRIFYFGNCRADDVVETVVVEARLEKIARPSSEDLPFVPGAVVTLTMALTEKRSRRLVALCETRKLLAIPVAQVGLIRDAERMLARHGEHTPMKELKQ
jgi:probable biosynthetic protein (TIGR04098 family)